MSAVCAHHIFKNGGGGKPAGGGKIYGAKMGVGAQ